MNAKRSLRTRSTDPATGPRALRLQMRRARQRLISALAITGLVATGGAVYAVTLAPAQSAEAAEVGDIATGFEIDANKNGAEPPNTFDWNDFLQPSPPNADGSFTFTPTGPYTTVDGLQSTGIIDGTFQWDNGSLAAACGGGGFSDGTGSPGTQKLPDNPWLPGGANVADKGDGCSTANAFEVVTDDQGVEHVIYYMYWTRLEGNGDMSTFQILEGGDPGRCDDFAIEFNYNSAGSGSTSVSVQQWAPTSGNCDNPNGPGTWVPVTSDFDFDAAVGQRVEGPGTLPGDPQTFGELAVDLTTAGVFNDDECTAFASGQVLTRTGNSPTAEILDYMIPGVGGGITISNCGGLVVEKVGLPDGVDDGTEFPYVVDRTGNGPVLPPSVVAIEDSVGIGKSNSHDGVFAADDYTLTETIPENAPWAQQSINCTVTPPGGNEAEVYDVDAGDEFPIYVGATTTCTITNATSGVTITKVADGDAGTEFDFTVTGRPNVKVVGKPDGGTTSDVMWFTPGSTVDIAEIAEQADPQWHLVAIVCDTDGDDQNDVDLALGSASLTTIAGQIIDCTFTNVQDGQIKIIKQVQGDGGEFDFTGDWAGGSDFTLEPGDDGEDAESFTNITPGQYTVEELTTGTEYDVTKLTCEGDVAGDTSSGDVATGKGTIDLDPGELVTCTYTNTQRGDLTVVKQTIPDGATQTFDFTVEGQPDFSLTDGGEQAFDNIKPDTYTLEEVNLPTGWKVDNIACAVDGGVPSVHVGVSKLDVVVGIGESVVCTVTNEATKGSLEVTKHVENVPAGDPWGPFELSLSDAPASETNPQSVDDGDPTAVWDNLVVGKTYTITETVPDGWTLKSFTCNVTDQDQVPNTVTFTVTPGLVVECDVTNAAEPGQVTLEKTVSGVAPGFGWSFDFTISPAEGVTPSAKQTVSGSGNSSSSITWENLTVGETYTITETAKPGWESGAVSCDIDDADPNMPGDQFTVTPGFTLTCEATNRAVPATAVITKNAIGADGTFEFELDPLMPDGAPIVQSVSVTAGGSNSTTFVNLVPGTTYAIAEVAPPAGWTAGTLMCQVRAIGTETWTDITETGFTVQPGDTFECTITNTAKATIVITKDVDGDDGTFSFTGTWLDPQGFTMTTVNGTKTNTYTDVLPGTYKVTELLTSAHVGVLQCTDPDQGSSVDGLVGTIDLDPGETVICTYSNTQLGKIIVDKVVPGAGSIPGGTTQVFDFEFGDDGFTLTDGDDPWESGLLAPGEYTVEELAEANWHLTDLQCIVGDGDDTTVGYAGALATIDLAAGDTVLCTYENAPDTGDLTVVKSVDGVPEGYDFAFDIFLTPGDPASQQVTDDDPSVEWNDLVVGQTYTLAEGDEAGWNEGEFVCNSGGLVDADANADGFQFVVTPGLSIDCEIENTAVPGEVTVEKLVSGAPEGFAWSFQMAISPTEGVEGDSPQTVSGTGPDATDTATWSNLEVGEQYVLTELPVPAGWTGGEIVCSVGGDLLSDENGDDPGFAFTAAPGLEVACELVNKVIAPTGVITKELTEIAQRTDGTWDLEYEVTVTNQSPVAPLVYDLEDEPQFGADIVINDAAATGPADSSAATWNPIGDPPSIVLADDTSVPASQTDTYVITINATVPASTYETGQDQCQEGDGGGFRNTAWLTVGHGEPQEASACDVPGRTTIVKSLDGDPVRDAETDDWTVEYDVVVTNESALRDQYYDLSDDLGFPEGVAIVSAEATTDAPDTGSVDVADWNGDTVTQLADDAPIAAGAVHTYHITVVADVDEITDIGDVKCVESTSGTGFFNAATLDNGTITTDVDACAEIPVGRLMLAKHVDLSAFDGVDLADLGFGDVEHLAPNDWWLIATGATETVNVLGDAGTVFTLPTGDYALSEEPTDEASTHPLLEYFFSQGWTCDGGEAGETATVELGELTSCELTNTAELVDVGIEKSYELPDGATAVDAGEPFDYVLTVTNHGSVTLSDLDVSDTIDAQLEVLGEATFTDPETGEPVEGWTQAFDPETNAFTAHGTGEFGPGALVTITIPVQLKQPAPVETPDVVGPDDPVPATPEIDLDDIPNRACVEITGGGWVPAEGEEPLPDLIAANDCDDVEVPKKAIDPAAYVRCIADVPWLYYDLAASDSVEPGDITVTWTSGDGTLTVTQTIPWDERDGRLLWPGAAVDENGVPYEFPGWRPITEEDLTNPPTPGTRFGDLILDDTVPTYPWHDMVNPATITFSVNPSQSVLAVYPQSLPACELDREPAVSIVKEASVTQAKPGTDFEYTLSVSTTGIGAADPVEVFDEIPSELKVTDITTAGSPTFPRWENCEVTGQDDDGYGGLLHCDLLGVLGPNSPDAPDIVLDVHVDPDTTSTKVENIGEVCWQNADDESDDPAVLCDDDSVTVAVPHPMPATGFTGQPFIWGAAGLVILGGLLVAAGVVIRRRKQQEHQGAPMA